jgi:hypothetical protein
MKPALKRNIIFALILLIGLSFLVKTSLAETNHNVDATVKLGVCGNDLAEDNEDCDNADLKGKTCETIGYASGTLSCLPSCDYDTTLCISIVSPTGKDTGNNGSGGFHSDKPTINTTKENAITYTIPMVIKLFDTNGDGKLTQDELYGLTKKWFDVWKTTLADQIAAGNQGTQAINKAAWACDLNGDGICDLVDFSVLMYYVGR